MNTGIKNFLSFILGLSLFFSGCSVQRYYNVSTQQEEVYFYSTEKEVKIGQSMARQVAKSFKFVDDALKQKKIEEIGQRLASVSARKEISYHFKLIDKDDINAFALPGGYVYMFSGLWNDIEKDDDEIAAVLAHEIAHINARHSITRLQNSLGYTVLSVFAAGTPNADSVASRRQAIAGINQLLLAYSREEELQADSLAVAYMKAAGYDPKKVIELLDYLQKKEREKPVRFMPVRTHPYISERVRLVKELVHGGNIGFNDYINTKD